MLVGVLLALAAAASEAAAPQDLVSATYSLSSLAAPEADTEFAIALLPYRPRGVTRSEPASSRARHLPGDDVVDLVRRVVAPEEWEVPGRSIEFVPGQGAGSLSVRAPAAVHAEVRRCLTFLASHVRRAARVECSAYSVTRVIDGLESLAGASDAGVKIGEWVKSGALVPVLRSSLALHASSPVIVARARERAYLVDYDVEIAEASAIHDAIVATAQLGVEVAARADVIDADEVILHFAARHAEEKSPPRAVDASARVEVAIESKLVFERREPGWIEAPVIEFQALAGAIRLETGRIAVAFVAPIAADDAESRGLLLSFELTSLSPAPAQFESGGRLLTVADLAASLDPGVDVPELSPAAGSLRNELDAPEWVGFASPVEIRHLPVENASPRNAEIVATRLLAALPESASLDIRAGFAITVSTTPVADAIARAVTGLRVEPSAASLLGFATPEPGSSEPGSVAFSIPLAGGRALALCGVEQNLLVDADVDVANRAAIANPSIATMLFGRFVEAAIDPDAAGDARVDLRGFGRARVSAIDLLSHNASGSPRFERVESCATRFSAAVELGDGAAETRVSPAFPTAAGGALDLVLRRVAR